MSRTGLGPVRWFDEIDSTNRYLVDEARSGAEGGLVAVARYQTAGRGRLGRSWEARAGANLLLSVLLRPALIGSGNPGNEVGPHDCTIAVALAAADLCRIAAGVDPGLKWPNDLVVEGQKLAGVLAELVSGPVREGGRPTPESAAVVVGLGLNVRWPPPNPGDDPMPGATSLARLTKVELPGLEVLVDILLERLDVRLGDLFGPAGAETQVAEYKNRCVTIGRNVKVEEPTGSLIGRAVDISPDGHLVVDTGSDTRIVMAGDVVHLGHVVGVLRPEDP
jgi:BirA family biotin operon repressor/biotin-[acetyl-CoA-carboxylase] ligase